MAGDVNKRLALVVDVATQLGERVDDALDALLVAGNGVGRDDDRVALVNREPVQRTTIFSSGIFSRS